MVDDRDAMLTPEQVAEWLQVHPGTVYRWLKEGKLPALQVGRVYRIPKGDVLAMIGRQGELSATGREWELAIANVANREPFSTEDSEGAFNVIRKRVFPFLTGSATLSIGELKYRLHNPLSRADALEDVPEATMQQAEDILEEAARAMSSEED